MSHRLTPPMNAVSISEQLIRRFDRSGPRYTSYPTADRFAADFKENYYITALETRQLAASPPPYSLYVHLPFCASLCYFCACNKIITQDHERSSHYVETLLAELQLLEPYLGQARATTQLHLGGGTPTFLKAKELITLMRGVRQHLDLTADAELSIEIDPRTVNAETLAFLTELGFNRTSFGVQDFDVSVQQAINRVQPLEMVETAIAASRAVGFESVNADLIYGLPKQSIQSFSQTVESLIDLRPDRIALYNYAHLPQRFKSQRLINPDDLPSAEERLQIFLMATQQLLDAGYEYIGLDHFALPNDELSLARLDQSLHRNFQGYTTRAHSDLIGLGVSAIGKIGNTHIQNQRSLKEYRASIDSNKLATFRGHVMDQDDCLRHEVIMTLMCSMPVDFYALSQQYGLEVSHYFAAELLALQPYKEAGLVDLTTDGIEVTAKGRLFVRAISMEFDRYLRQSTDATYSRLI